MNWKSKRCLVTGGAGFGGAHLCEALAQMDAVVYVYDRHIDTSSYFKTAGVHRKVNCILGDLRDLSYFKTVLARYELDLIFHLGAQPIVHLSNDMPYETFESNTVGTVNVLEAVRITRPKCGIIFASTGGIYGSISQEALISENSLPINGNNIYAVSKLAAEFFTRYYANVYGLNAACCRFMQTYGPGDTNFSRIIPFTIQALLEGKTPEITRSDGTPEWDFMYVKDMSRAYIKVAEQLDKVKGEAFNFGGGNPISVKDIVKKMARIYLGKNIEPIIHMKPSGKLQRKCLSIDKAVQTLKWNPEYTLDQGLKETLEWYQTHWSKLII